MKFHLESISLKLHSVPQYVQKEQFSLKHESDAAINYLKIEKKWKKYDIYNQTEPKKM